VPGVVNIKVVNPDAQEAVLENAFTYEALPLGPAPTITSINPNSDFVTGGTFAFIEGTGIDKNAKVYFGETEVSIDSYNSASSIRVRVPAAAVPGVVNIKVVNPDAQEAVLESAFTYEALPAAPAPAVTSITPNSALETGGVFAVINGSNFDKNAKVYFGVTEVAINYYYSSSSIRVRVPVAVPGVVDIKVVNPDGQEGVLANGFTYEALIPSITSVAGDSGPLEGGNTVQIYGVNFHSDITAMVGGVPAEVFYSNSTHISVKVPAGLEPGIVDLTIKNPNGFSAAVAYTYLAPAPILGPTITTISPNSGYITGGEFAVINGENFDSNAKVYFGETEVAINYYYSSLSIRVRVPAVTTPGAIDIRVVNPNGQEGVLRDGYTYEALPLAPAPTITSITPNSGLVTGGYYGIINGSNFDKNAKVYFGGVEVPINYYYSSSRIRVRVPAASASGAVDVKVVNPDGQEGVLGNGFTYQ
jgi:hypothetical protein